MADSNREKNSGQLAGKKLTALFTVRRWLRDTPCSAAQASVLFALAAFAQPDGTGIHPGVDDLIRITKYNRRSIIRALKVWRFVEAITRTKAGNRRARQADEYKINLDWQPSKVGPDDFRVGRSNVTLGHLRKGDRVSHLKKSKVTSNRSKVTSEASNVTLGHPSEESFSEKAIPSKNQPPISPLLQNQQQGDSKEVLYSWCFEIIAIRMGRRKRLPNLDTYLDEPAQTVCDALCSKGFPARIVTGTTIMPDHVVRLDPDPRFLKSPLISRTQADYKIRQIRREIVFGFRCDRCYKRECVCPEQLKMALLPRAQETRPQNS